MSEEPEPAAFEPVPTRSRHDGWTAGRQVAFLDALAQSGCVKEACRAVDMSTQSAYALKTRPDAESFRHAWSAALYVAGNRLADALFSRAIKGVAIPHFYKGEKIGEHRRYDNRLGIFLLQRLFPVRYAISPEHLEGPALEDNHFDPGAGFHALRHHTGIDAVRASGVIVPRAGSKAAGGNRPEGASAGSKRKRRRAKRRDRGSARERADRQSATMPEMMSPDAGGTSSRAELPASSWMTSFPAGPPAPAIDQPSPHELGPRISFPGREYPPWEKPFTP